MTAAEANVIAWNYYNDVTKGVRRAMWSLDHQITGSITNESMNKYTGSISSAMVQQYIDRFQGKDLILSQDHSMQQFDYDDYMTSGMLEKLYNNFKGRELVVNSNYEVDTTNGYLHLYDIVKAEIFDQIPDLGVIKTELTSQEAGLISTQGINFAQFREKWAPDVDYGKRYWLHYDSEFWTTSARWTARHLYAEMYCTLSQFSKIMRVFSHGGMLSNGVRLVNTEWIERQFLSLTQPEDLDATVHLRGSTDDCFGARWRNMCALGGVARGPQIPTYCCKRLDLLTKFVNDNERFPTDPVMGEGPFWPIAQPPSRCIVIRNQPVSPVFMYFFPDLDLTMVIQLDDAVVASIKEFGAAQVAFSNEASATLTGKPFEMAAYDRTPTYPTVVAGPNENLSNVAHLN